MNDARRPHPHGPRGALTHDGGDAVITFSRDFDADPARVWEALTTSDGLGSWLAPHARIDARLGGSVRLVFDADNIVTGTITEFDPPRSLEHSWTFDGVVSTIRYTLEPSGSGSRLTLVHRGLPDDVSRGYTPGWHAYLVRLEATLEGRPPPEWMDVFEAVTGLYS